MRRATVTLQRVFANLFAVISDGTTSVRITVAGPAYVANACEQQARIRRNEAARLIREAELLEQIPD